VQIVSNFYAGNAALEKVVQGQTPPIFGRNDDLADPQLTRLRCNALDCALIVAAGRAPSGFVVQIPDRTEVSVTPCRDYRGDAHRLGTGAKYQYPPFEGVPVYQRQKNGARDQHADQPTQRRLLDIPERLVYPAGVFEIEIRRDC